MNRTASIVVIALMASTAFAQSAATPGAVRNALAAPAQAKTAPAPAAPVKPAASATATTAKKPPSTAKVAKTPVEAKSKAAETASKPSGAKVTTTGKRDPFVSPVSDRVGGGAGCSTGKKCLMPDQVLLQGVVKGPNGMMIAVVVNSARTAYFMRVNDPVFNGYVVKITPDSIVFKETTQDRMGKPVSREVVKKVNTPAV